MSQPSDWAMLKAESLAGDHYYCEDTWYSCPQHAEGCADYSAGKECRCGQAERVRRIATALDEARASGEARAEVGKLKPVEVSFSRDDVARVYGHKCDQPTCPACSKAKLQVARQLVAEEPGGLVRPSAVPEGALGHEFIPCDDADVCLYGYEDEDTLGCGQPGAAHPPEVKP